MENRIHLASNFVRRLSLFSAFSADERAELARAVTAQTRRVPARRTISVLGEHPQYVSVVLEGWACGYKETSDGRRQILGLFLPGEHCDSSIYILDRLDHSLEALTDVTLGEIAPTDFRRLMGRSVAVAEALWWEELVSSAIKREWIFTLTQRTALERIAHLFCELYLRLSCIGLAECDEMPFPLTQTDLAETAGLSPVHVNRMVQQLRARRLITLSRRRLRILDPPGLAHLAGFDPHYLHLSAHKS